MSPKEPVLVGAGYQLTEHPVVFSLHSLGHPVTEGKRTSRGVCRHRAYVGRGFGNPQGGRCTPIVTVKQFSKGSTLIVGVALGFYILY